jgi:hypothetical protein
VVKLLVPGRASIPQAASRLLDCGLGILAHVFVLSILPAEIFRFVCPSGPLIITPFLAAGSVVGAGF